MSMSTAEVIARIKAIDHRKVLRYSAVSFIAVPMTQIILLVFHSGLGWSGLKANTMAVAVTVVPVYVLNRYWVWGKRDKNNFVTEILPFWGMTLLGLLISTLCVAYADRHFESPLMVNVANAFGFGVVWVLKFAVLDRLMFGNERHFPIEEEVLEDAGVTEEQLVADGFVEGEIEAKLA